MGALSHHPRALCRSRAGQRWIHLRALSHRSLDSKVGFPSCCLASFFSPRPPPRAARATSVSSRSLPWACIEAVFLCSSSFHIGSRSELFLPPALPLRQRWRTRGLSHDGRPALRSEPLSRRDHVGTPSHRGTGRVNGISRWRTIGGGRRWNEQWWGALGRSRMGCA